MDLNGCGNNKSGVGKIPNKRDPVWFQFAGPGLLRAIVRFENSFCCITIISLTQ